MTTFKIHEHFQSSPEWPLWVIVATTTKGYCYAAPSAGEQPTEEVARNVWKTKRDAFQPFNSTTGCLCDQGKNRV